MTLLPLLTVIFADNLFYKLKDVTQGLMYMHSEEMVHGDLKGVGL